MDFYRGDGAARDDVSLTNKVLTDKALASQLDPSEYRLIQPGASDEENQQGLKVVRAINTSLALRMPLLVSGEPGSGKTQLGYAIAHELGRPPPFKFVTKSVSTARDLLYNYDAVQHFRAAQIEKSNEDAQDFITYSPLGLAILLALKGKQRAPFLSGSDKSADKNLTPARQDIFDRLSDPEPQQSVVIIDEIDKAPRDFPNDLLHELENMSFKVPELEGIETPKIEPAFKPIVIITTNSERQLPEAFLRRCAYVHLEYPSGEMLDAILSARLKKLFENSTVLMQDTARFYEDLRQNTKLSKPPGTAELLQFLQGGLAHGAKPDTPLLEQLDILQHAVSLLGKTRDDQAVISDKLKNWKGPKED